jgi:ankyrin repeat protein
VNVVSLLAELGANVNASSADHCPSSICTVTTLQFAMIRILIDHNADANIASMTGVTPRILASQIGNVAGANTNAINSDKLTAVHLAVFKGYVYAVITLVKLGANVLIRLVSLLCMLLPKKDYSIACDHLLSSGLI